MYVTRIAAVPLFSNLRRFPEGHGFKQWTGDNSKALMKVYLPAIIGYVPDQMVRAIALFIEFCYIVRRSVIDENDLDKLDELLARYHQEREVFRHEGIRSHFNLPRQHALTHYRELIRKFGAPNGLCSSITESKHIEDVKRPYRRSSRFNALYQMIRTVQRLAQLKVCAVDFQARGMLRDSIWTGHIDPPPNIPSQKAIDEDDDNGGAIENREIIGEVKLARKPGA